MSKSLIIIFCLNCLIVVKYFENIGMVGNDTRPPQLDANIVDLYEMIGDHIPSMNH